MTKQQLNAVEKTFTVKELAQTQKAHIEKIHQTMAKEAEKLGAKDGVLNLPQEKDSLTSPNEGLIKSEYQKLIADCWEKGKHYLDEPHIEYQTLIDELAYFDNHKEVLSSEAIARAETQKQADIEAVNREYNTRITEVEDEDKMLRRDFIEAKQNLEEVQEKVGRKMPLIHFKSTWLYVLLLLGIGFCEVPLNIQIFQKFGEAFYITIIMACSLAISIPVLAHFSGVFIKQRSEKKEYYTFGFISVMLFIIFNFGVSIFRTYVLAQYTGELASNLNIVIFTCLNLILFIIGVLAAYFSHDESYELEHTYEKFQIEKKKYNKQKIAIQKRIKDIKEEQNRRIKTAETVFASEKMNLYNKRTQLVKKRNEAISLYDALLNSFNGLEAYVDASYRIAIEKYRAANLINRRNHISPKSWEKGINPLHLKFETCKELDPN